MSCGLEASAKTEDEHIKKTTKDFAKAQNVISGQ